MRSGRGSRFILDSVISVVAGLAGQESSLREVTLRDPGEGTARSSCLGESGAGQGCSKPVSWWGSAQVRMAGGVGWGDRTALLPKLEF